MAKTENHSIDIESRDEQNASFAKPRHNIYASSRSDGIIYYVVSWKIGFLLIPITILKEGFLCKYKT